MSEPVIACSLNADQQGERRELISDLGSRALIEARALPAGLQLRFSTQPGIEEELEQLIEAESECCSFLRFELHRHEGDLVLEVNGPDLARPLIRELFGVEEGEVLARCPEQC